MKRLTPTLAICAVVAGLAVIGLFRSGDTDPPAVAASEPVAASTSTPAAPTGSVITIASFSYSGADSGQPGATITVDNVDGAPHTVTARDGSFDTGLLQPGESGSVTLPTEPGTYEYFCALHPSMVSTITVTG